MPSEARRATLWLAVALTAALLCLNDAAKKSVKLLKKATLKVVPGGPHGMATTMTDQINKELLAFVRD